MIWEGAAKEAAIETILEQLLEGRSLREIMADGDLPGRSTFLRWVAEDQQLAARYGAASQDGYDLRAERAVEEARAATDPALGRLAFDAERWFLGKRHPKKYGDRVDLNHSGSISLGQALDALPDD